MEDYIAFPFLSTLHLLSFPHFFFNSELNSESCFLHQMHCYRLLLQRSALFPHSMIIRRRCTWKKKSSCKHVWSLPKQEGKTGGWIYTFHFKSNAFERSPQVKSIFLSLKEVLENLESDNPLCSCVKVNGKQGNKMCFEPSVTEGKPWENISRLQSSDDKEILMKEFWRRGTLKFRDMSELY